MKRYVFLGFSVLSFLIMFSACGEKQVETESKEKYETVIVKKIDRVLRSNYAAVIHGQQDIDIFSQISGTITEVKVKEGQVVKKGQVLFVIDQVPYKSAYQVAVANLEAAKVNVESEKLAVESKQSLFDKKIISEYELKVSENKLLVAKAAYEQAQAQKINAANNLSYTEIKAPCNGVVGVLPYKVGALVSPGTNVLTTVSDNANVHVYFSVTEKDLLEAMSFYNSPDSSILEQMPEVELLLNNGATYEHKGKIESISGVINRATGTAQMKAVFPNPKNIIMSGSSGTLVIPWKYDSIIVVPQEATIERQNLVFVYKIVDGVATSTQIEVEVINDGKEYIVLSGLEDGDEIIVKGAGLVHEGTKIR